MSSPMAIKSNLPSKQSIAQLLQFPPSPPFSSERHACAFPSWPDRPNLSDTSSELSSRSSSSSSFFSDMDLCDTTVRCVRPAHRKKPSNYLELEFEDDSEDEESAVSAQRAVPNTTTYKPKVASKSLLGEQLQREKMMREQNKRKHITSAPHAS